MQVSSSSVSSPWTVLISLTCVMGMLSLCASAPTHLPSKYQLQIQSQNSDDMSDRSMYTLHERMDREVNQLKKKNQQDTEKDAAKVGAEKNTEDNAEESDAYYYYYYEDAQAQNADEDESYLEIVGLVAGIIVIVGVLGIFIHLARKAKQGSADLEMPDDPPQQQKRKRFALAQRSKKYSFKSNNSSIKWDNYDIANEDESEADSVAPVHPTAATGSNSKQFTMLSKPSFMHKGKDVTRSSNDESFCSSNSNDEIRQAFAELKGEQGNQRQQPMPIVQEDGPDSMLDCNGFDDIDGFEDDAIDENGASDRTMSTSQVMVQSQGPDETNTIYDTATAGKQPATFPRSLKSNTAKLPPCANNPIPLSPGNTNITDEPVYKLHASSRTRAATHSATPYTIIEPYTIIGGKE